MFEEMRRAGLADPIYVQSSASVRLTLSAVPVKGGRLRVSMSFLAGVLGPRRDVDRADT